jgi:hypothetical protein
MTGGPFLVDAHLQKMQELCVTHCPPVQLSPTASSFGRRGRDRWMEGPTRSDRALPGTRVPGYLMDVSTDASTGSPGAVYRSRLCLLVSRPHPASLHRRQSANGIDSADVEALENYMAATFMAMAIDNHFPKGRVGLARSMSCEHLIT